MLERPSDPKQAKEWLRRVADHLSTFPNAGYPFHFVASAIDAYLADPKNRDLYEELCLIQPRPKRGRGQPKISFETEVEIIRKHYEGHSKREISKALNVVPSRITRTITKLNKVLGIRPHGAKPDRFSIEDAREYAAKLPEKELIALLAATITLKSILPEEE